MALHLQTGSVISLPGLEGERFVVGDERQGGMGRVYQLVSLRPGAQVVALKTFLDAVPRTDFEREARVWAAIGQHPNIASALWYGFIQGTPGVLTEWCDLTLMDLSASKIGAQRTVEVSQGVLRGLAHAERLGLVHQDVKPANILVDKLGVPRVADFGIARALGGPASADTHRAGGILSGATVGGELAGTPRYMAPELWAGTARPSTATDMYSYGVTVYEWLTGQHPYAGPETRGNFRSVLRSAPLVAVGAALGPGVQALLGLVQRCLALDARDRPSGYVEALREIGGLVEWSESEASHSLALQARVLREQGRSADAEALLLSGLRDDRDNPELLNALGILRRELKQSDLSLAAFGRAHLVLSSTKGEFNGALYLDASANLVLAYLDAKRIQDAVAVAEVVWMWQLEAPVWYREFGWMWVAKGQPERGFRYLVGGLRTRAADWVSLGSIAVAWWSVGSPSEWVNDVIEVIREPDLRDPFVALSFLFLTARARGPAVPALRQRALSVFPADVAAELAHMHGEIQLATIAGIDGRLFGGHFTRHR